MQVKLVPSLIKSMLNFAIHIHIKMFTQLCLLKHLVIIEHYMRDMMTSDVNIKQNVFVASHNFTIHNRD